jgi:hypothetical protein
MGQFAPQETQIAMVKAQLGGSFGTLPENVVPVAIQLREKCPISRSQVDIRGPHRARQEPACPQSPCACQKLASCPSSHIEPFAVSMRAFPKGAPPVKTEGPWLMLDLAEVRINGTLVGTVWKKPYRVKVTGTLHPGANRVDIKCANVWRNRLAGDLQPGQDRPRETGCRIRAPRHPARMRVHRNASFRDLQRWPHSTA